MINSVNFTDTEGNPSGGHVLGRGIAITWQNGPLVKDGVRQQPNGAFIEDLLEIIIGRIEFYQTASNGKFACLENEVTLQKLREALESQKSRTRKREERGVEGTNIP